MVGRAATRWLQGLQPSLPGCLRSWAVMMLLGLVPPDSACASISPSAAVARLGTPLIDARGMTLTFGARYGIMINGGVSGNEVISSIGGHQYTAYFVRNDTISPTAYHLAVARRQAPSRTGGGSAWEVVDLVDATFTRGQNSVVNGVPEPENSHAVAALGIDRTTGTLHLAWDMHNSLLKYRTSIPGLTSSPGSWTAAAFLPTTSELSGQRVTGVTYPNFVTNPDGRLDLFHRIGTSSSGHWVSRGQTSGGGWRPAIRIDDGNVGTYQPVGSTDRTSYPNGFEYDHRGRLHMTGVWREAVAQGGNGTNHGLWYAFSDDRGQTWMNNAGEPIASATLGTRITIDSPGLVVRPLSHQTGLMNTQAQAVDGAGRVHAVMWHLDTALHPGPIETFVPSVSSAFHYWRDDLGNWMRTRLPGPVSGARPRMYFDADDNAVALVADGSLKVYAATRATHWTDWTLVHVEPGYASDAVADRELFRSSGVLSVFQQRPPSSSLEATEIRSVDLAPTFRPPTPRRFTATDGSWGAPSHWNGGLPGTSHLALVDGDRTVGVRSGDPSVLVHSLGLGTAHGDGDLIVTGGSLQAAHSILVGMAGDGRGTFTQTGGTVQAGRFTVGAYDGPAAGGGRSQATISGGTLSVRDLSIGVAAGGSSSGSTFTLAGTGSVQVSGDVLLADCGNAATLKLIGGSMTVAGDLSRGFHGQNQATLGLFGGVLDMTGNAIVVDRLVLGSGRLQSAAAVTAREIVLEDRPGGISFPGTPHLQAIGTTATGLWTVSGSTGLPASTLVVRGQLNVWSTTALTANDVVVEPGGILHVPHGIQPTIGRVTLAGGDMTASRLTLARVPGGIDQLLLEDGSLAGQPVLSIHSGGELALSTSSWSELTLTAVQGDWRPGGGRIDLGAGGLAILPGGATPADLRSAIIAGRNGGSWDGPSGILSSRARPGAGDGFAVGYRIAADTSATVALAALGDADLDGAVTTADVNAMLTGGLLNAGVGGANWQQGDFDYDGFVTTADVNAMLTSGRLNAGSYLSSIASAGAGGLTAQIVTAPSPIGVPEPSAMMLVGIGGATGLMIRRCRRCQDEG
jgi:hypothetical protein